LVKYAVGPKLERGPVVAWHPQSVGIRQHTHVFRVPDAFVNAAPCSYVIELSNASLKLCDGVIRKATPSG
jgi:hypothetical protein